MKIVYLTPSAQLGGAERALLDVLACVRSAEPEWSLYLISAADGPIVAKATALGVETMVLPFPTELARVGDAATREPRSRAVRSVVALPRLLQACPATGKYLGQLRQALRDLTPDVVHTNGSKMHILGAWAKTRRVPLVWHVHEYVTPRSISRWLLRFCSSRCSAAVANSHSVARDVQSACGVRLPIHMIHNAVDLERFSSWGSVLDLDTLAGLPPVERSTVRVGLVATLGRWKGHAVFLEALALLPRDLSVRGYVIGDALYQTDGSQYTLNDLRGMAARLHVQDRVGFTGFIEDMPAAMRALDLVVHASTQPEPFGLVIAEAMACGRTVLVSHAGGVAEIIEGDVDAVVYPPGDSAALARHIRDLAQHPERRTALGRRARAAAERRFDRNRLAAELVPIYRRLTSLAA